MSIRSHKMLALLLLSIGGFLTQFIHAAEYGSSVMLGRWGGFELGTVVDDSTTSPDEGKSGKWSKQNNDVSISLNTSQKRTGSASLKVMCDSYSWDDGVYSPLYTLTSGQKVCVQYYRMVVDNLGRAKNKTGLQMGGNLVMSSRTYPDTTYTWQKVTWVVTIPTTGTGNKYVETRHMGGGNVWKYGAYVY